jgi:hypothetical protein
VAVYYLHIKEKHNMTERMTAKVVYNSDYGGFGLSAKALAELSALKEAKGEKFDMDDYRYGGLPRHDPDLVAVVEKLGEEASGRFAYLRVKELKGKRYRIDEYDGSETVREPDDYEWIVVEG